MNSTDNPGSSSWDKIQSGVRETERMIGQKKYNMAMIKARQTLEYMVKCLCEKADIPEDSLIDMIDALHEDGVISKTTCEHYHKIRTIGNKAIHEEDNSAYNANQAHHLLSQEVYTFANDYGDNRKRTPARRQTTDQPQRRSRSTSAPSRRRATSSRPSIELSSLIKPLLLIAIIVVLIFIIRMIRPDAEDPTDTSTAEVTMESNDTTSETTPTTEPSTPAAVVMYRTTDTINVRSSADTAAANKLGLLAPGTEVEYVRDHDDTFCVIMYNGQEAFAAKEFLEPVE